MVTVENKGDGPMRRLRAWALADKAPLFDRREFLFGLVKPGEKKTWTVPVKLPKGLDSRHDEVRLHFEEEGGRAPPDALTSLDVLEAPKPTFAFSTQVEDQTTGNGDGLVQRGEHYRLQVQIKNTGAGPTQEATVLLRNATGDGVVLDKSRAELKDALAPGQIKEIEFPLATDAMLKGDEMVVELMAYDAALDVQASDKLHFKLAPTVPSQPRTGEVITRAQATIRAGASDDASIVGYAARGASYPVIASFGTWTKVKLNAGGTKVGFLPSSAVSSGGTGQGQFTQVWNSTPPMIALNLKGLETSADTYKLSGNISGEQHVEDVYIFVSNRSAKIESRKVFYRSNRGGKDGKLLDFSTDLPLWPGSNMVTVVARASSEVRSVKTMFVYRDPPRTAQAP
jgi:carboxyl-terminal processing protease